jgi:protein-L-isoaspartate(D-aspartate) O-methyltransferase
MRDKAIPKPHLPKTARSLERSEHMRQYRFNNIEGDWHKLNQALVDSLKQDGHIYSPCVEAAFLSVPRHKFLPGVSIEEAYSNRTIPTKYSQGGQVISSSSSPTMIATMLEQLGLESGQRVLEIGTGTGYNTTLIAHIVGERGQVITVDIYEDLVETAQEHIATMGFDQIHAFCANGEYGYPEAAPYDRIVLTAAAQDIAPAWIEQLKPDGRLVLPFEIIKGRQQSIAFEQTNDHLESVSVRDCVFIPLQGVAAATLPAWAQVGSKPGLLISAYEELPVDTETIYDWLTRPSLDREVDVEVTLQEMSGLGLWLVLQEPELRWLVVRDTIRNIVLPLARSADSRSWVASGVLFGDEGLAVLGHLPDQPGYSDGTNKRFRLCVSQFGPDNFPAYRLLKLVRTWCSGGRLSTRRLRVLAYPKDSMGSRIRGRDFDHTSAKDEFVIEKQWTRLVLDWLAPME